MGLRAGLSRRDPNCMRLIVLQGLAVIATLVFVTMLVATALHRSAGGSENTYRISALAEYLWTVVPWLMMGACVLPAVRRIVAGG
jgi:heme/copper-type cytochrome/quinol oxidase subunit 2